MISLSTACKFLFEALVLHFSTNSLYKSYWNSFTHSYWKTIRKIELDKVFFVKVGYECQTLEWLSKICIKNRINARLYNNNEWTQILGVREKKNSMKKWKSQVLHYLFVKGRSNLYTFWRTEIGLKWKLGNFTFYRKKLHAVVNILQKILWNWNYNREFRKPLFFQT